MNDKIKKLLMGIGAFGALAFGGAQLAGAQGNGGSSTPEASQTAEQPGSEAVETPGTEKADGNEKADGSEKADGNEKDGEQADTVTGPAAEHAKAAALAEVGSGKVTDLSAENHSADKADKAEKPDPGEKADPAYESQIAYDAEVTKADGSVVDVHMDKAFKVLGSEPGDQEGSGGE